MEWLETAVDLAELAFDDMFNVSHALTEIFSVVNGMSTKESNVLGPLVDLVSGGSLEQVLDR